MPIMRLLLDERSRRAVGREGRSKGDFVINVQADRGPAWMEGVNCYAEGIGHGDLVILTDWLSYEAIGIGGITLLLESDIAPGELSNHALWKKGDGYYVGYTVGLSDRKVQITPYEPEKI